MRCAHHLHSLLALSSLALAFFNCEAELDGFTFDFKALKGSHSVILPPKEAIQVTINTTWIINPCGPIEIDKDVPSKEQCPEGTQVCGIERVSSGDDNPKVVIIPVAGDIEDRKTDEHFQRLKTTDSAHDANKEGLRVTLGGGEYEKSEQQAIIDFVCDPDRTGLEGDETGEDENKEKRKENGEEKEKEKEKAKKSLSFVSYHKQNDKKHVLKLEWKTKYACETAKGGDETPGQGSGWGFFTWFIIILFLGVAAYLIFGSWLNHNRYGARGRFTTDLSNRSWDLLPHSDTIRDIPYLLKDWARRVIGTLQGRSGGRGGYSAV